MPEVTGDRLATKLGIRLDCPVCDIQPTVDQPTYGYYTIGCGICADIDHWIYGAVDWLNLSVRTKPLDLVLTIEWNEAVIEWKEENNVV